MKKILIFLPILFYSLCMESCGYETPKTREDCLDTVTQVNTTCCYLYEEKNDIATCFEIPDYIENKEEYVSKLNPALKNYVADCKGKYLVNYLMSIILLMALILV